MSDLIPHDVWMERTAVTARRRSAELKALDEELKRYGQFGGGQARWSVEQRLEAWKKSKGAGDAWRNSMRNKNRAFDDLTNALKGVQQTAEQREAIQLVKQHQKDFIKALFGGRKVSLSSKAMTAYQAASSAHTLSDLGSGMNLTRGASSRLVQGAETAALELVRNTLGDVWDLPELAEVVLDVLGKTVADLVKSITPAVGFVKSASQTAYYGVQTVSRAKDTYTLSGSEVGVAPGDPARAFKAVQALAKRELKKSGARFGVSASETAAKGAGLFADAGTGTTAAVGTAASIARLLITLNALRVDCLEMRAANKILKDVDRIDNTLFHKNPLLGCYFIVCADTSTLINFMFEDVGRPGFQYEVERAVKKHLDPTLKIASHLLYEHRMMLGGGELPKLTVLPGPGKKYKGQIAVRNPTTMHQAKAKALNKVRGRSPGFYK